jgi:hypothetical protein
VALAQSRLRRANLLLPARPRGGGPKRLIEVHTISSRDAIGTEAFLGRSRDVTSTEKMENMFLRSRYCKYEPKKCGDVVQESGRETYRRYRHWQGLVVGTQTFQSLPRRSRAWLTSCNTIFLRQSHGKSDARDEKFQFGSLGDDSNKFSSADFK